MRKDLERLRELNIAETRRKLSTESMDSRIRNLAKGNSPKELKAAVEAYAPSLCRDAGWEIAARLIASAKSLKKLAFMPASKIQLLGAEKAFFKSLSTGSKTPKHGLIAGHGSVKDSAEKGKAAKKMAAKIMVAARKDYFRLW